MKSKDILNIIALSNIYKCRPSSLLDDDIDEYTSYCFDEACAFIIAKMENDEEPQFTKKYKSFKDIYSKYN